MGQPMGELGVTIVNVVFTVIVIGLFWWGVKIERRSVGRGPTERDEHELPPQ